MRESDFDDSLIRRVTRSTNCLFFRSQELTTIYSAPKRLYLKNKKKNMQTQKIVKYKKRKHKNSEANKKWSEN